MSFKKFVTVDFMERARKSCLGQINITEGLLGLF